jgi:hypothetical protein
LTILKPLALINDEMRRAFVILLIIALFRTVVRAAPATLPSVNPAAAFHDAVPLIRQNKPTEALLLLQLAEHSYPRIVQLDEQLANILYAQAICLMMQGEHPKTHAIFDRIRPIENHDRAFILNDAKVDVAVPNLSIAAVKELDDYLASTISPDEEAINLFGAALDNASKVPANAKTLAQPMQDYVRYNSNLEATRPGMHHWGTQWISDADFQGIDAAKSKAQIALHVAQSDYQRARIKQMQAHIQYNVDSRMDRMPLPQNGRMNRPPMVTPQLLTNRQTTTSNDVDAADAEAQSCLDRVADANAQMPRPTFTPNLQPIVPESWDAVPTTMP